MTARLEYFLRNNVKTYRVTFADLQSSTNPSNGVLWELFGVANAEVKLRHYQVSKPSIAISPHKLQQNTIGSTGSTGQAVRSPVRIKADSTYAGVFRTYSVHPGSTSAVTPKDSGELQNIDIATTDVMNEHYGDDQGKFAPTLQGSSESFIGVITSTGQVTFNGYLEFTVEP